MDKLLKALNNVFFGQYHFRAKLVRFDRRIPKEGDVVRESEGVGGMSAGRVAGRAIPVRKGEVVGEKRTTGESGKKKEEVRVMKGWAGEMRVGSVVLKMGRKERALEGVGGTLDGVGLETSGRKISADMTTVVQKLERRYRPCAEDIEWASKGLVGTVLNGESIRIIQNRVEDVGFKDVDIIPLGADRVFLHSLSDVHIADIVGEAKPFFDLLFSSSSKWNKELIPFRRGAWLL